MNKEFKWDESLVLELAYSMYPSDDFKAAIREKIEQFKESKQPKPEWEIIAYQHKKTNEIAPKGTMGFAKVMYDPEYQIFQVSRLSDGEVFTIGDKYRNDSGMKEYTIKEFEIRNGELRANATEHGFDYLSDLIKIKQALFITEDGVAVTDDYAGKISILCHDWSYNIDWDKEDVKHTTYTKKLFSTKEALKEYILMNKPLFCISEIVSDVINLSAYKDNYIELFIQMAKEKLNKP